MHSDYLTEVSQQKDTNLSFGSVLPIFTDLSCFSEAKCASGRSVISRGFSVSGKRVNSTVLLIEPSVSVPIERQLSEISLNLSSESASARPMSSKSSSKSVSFLPPGYLEG